ncbi:hypothetical protein FHS26_000909 [Rhizobium pisi]|uniref:ABC transporter domain-containing protein n=1 Tax=Rhizobium pisi TaxID=574561 RepID=A0A7W5FYJ1_9HYPH|nr:hypothetical protein [Rhizobium pisi]
MPSRSFGAASWSVPARSVNSHCRDGGDDDRRRQARRARQPSAGGRSGKTGVDRKPGKGPDRSGLKTIEIDALTVRSGEIVGIAGISGNGQKELTEILAGQRPTDAGKVMVNGEAYGATRDETRKNKVRFIPEEPLQNACAPKMSVSENLAFRTFDLKANGKDAIWQNEEACLGTDPRLQGQDRLFLFADRSAFGRQRAAGGARPRTDRRCRSADRIEPLFRSRCSPSRSSARSTCSSTTPDFRGMPLSQGRYRRVFEPIPPNFSLT